MRIYKQDSGTSPTFIGPDPYSDCFVFEITDNNATAPDGGFHFAATGDDNIVDPLLTIRGSYGGGVGGSGSVGVGRVTRPQAKLDVGGDLMLRGYDEDGNVNKKVRFKVKSSSGSSLDDDDDDDDVEVTSEDEEGNEERATVTTRGVNIPVPESPGVVVRVRGGTGGVSEDPLLVVAGGVQIADENGNTSALMPTLSGGLRLGAVDGPQVDIDVTAGGGIDVKGPISGANVIASSLDLGGNSSLGLNDAGQLDLQGANGFAFRTDGQQVNFNISNTGVMGFNNEFGSNSVLQIGSAVESGGLLLRDGSDMVSLGVEGGGSYGAYVELSEEIFNLHCYGEAQLPGDPWTGWS
ncbi:MAG: hypothetical protein MK291_13405, partial [Planctomycetes bacterium]|nr:hypothetical protein [Planctomycetota bacterium]